MRMFLYKSDAVTASLCKISMVFLLLAMSVIKRIFVFVQTVVLVSLSRMRVFL